MESITHLILYRIDYLVWIWPALVPAPAPTIRLPLREVVGLIAHWGVKLGLEGVLVDRGGGWYVGGLKGGLVDRWGGRLVNREVGRWGGGGGGDTGLAGRKLVGRPSCFGGKDSIMSFTEFKTNIQLHVISCSIFTTCIYIYTLRCMHTQKFVAI